MLINAIPAGTRNFQERLARQNIGDRLFDLKIRQVGIWHALLAFYIPMCRRQRFRQRRRIDILALRETWGWTTFRPVAIRSLTRTSPSCVPWPTRVGTEKSELRGERLPGMGQSLSFDDACVMSPLHPIAIE